LINGLTNPTLISGSGSEGGKERRVEVETVQENARGGIIQEAPSPVAESDSSVRK
jgi:hypothetical protein